MKLEDILVDDSVTIQNVAKQLENVRCKVVYVVNNGKLIASVSDGDIRRSALKNIDVMQSVKMIANYRPRFFYSYEKDKIKAFWENSEMYSVPIINYNGEVVEVHFCNGKIIKRTASIKCPVVMMAGGKGTRLYPYTEILPKALIPIGEVPISEIILNRFVEYDCDHFYFIVNHKKKMIQAYYEGINHKYQLEFIEEEEPLGTGGGLFLLMGHIITPFFFINCDIIIDADYSEIYNFHKDNKHVITIVGAKYTSTIPYGVIRLDENGEYMDMQEKPSFECVMNTGMYVVSEEVFNVMHKNENISFPEIIERCKKKGYSIGAYIIEESAYMDMGQIEEMEKMKKKLYIN